jgi:thiol:disulfide interchange protein DsbD
MRRLGLLLLVMLGAACLAPAARAADDATVTLELVPDATSVAPGGAVGIEVVATIARGWHINANRPTLPFLKPTLLTITAPEGVTVDPVNYPPPDKRTFSFAGGAELLVYEGKIGLTSATHVPPTFAGDRVPLTATLQYQACNDTTCLRPTSVSASAELTVTGRAAAGAARQADDSAAPLPAGALRLNQWLAERGLLFTLAAVALLGLGLNLTPCVYPLISATLAYFGGQSRSRAHTALLAALYVLGIALSFSIGGLAAALSGGLFGAALQKPPVLLFIGAVMFTLALGSFGVYQLRPPTFVLQWVGGATTGAFGALFMGLTMGLVAAPCVGPIVVGLLIFVGSRQDPVLGFLLFFVLALGMGLPYLALAMVAGSLRQLPRSGEWLLWIERLFGCILLSLAAYYVAPLLPPTIRPWLLPAVIGLSGFYLGVIDRSGRRARSFAVIRSAVGFAMVLLAVWLAWPTASTQAIAWQPYEQWSSAAGDGTGDKPLLIDFVADWCIPCREMEHTTYVDPAVVREADRFRMVKADVTPDNDLTTHLQTKYDVRGVPTVILYSSRGDERQRMVGYVSPDELLAAMRAVQ